MRLTATPIRDLWEVRSEPRRDQRGSFMRVACLPTLIEAGALPTEIRFVQSNLSITHRRGTVRGMHLQRPPALEAKLVSCVGGRVFDVAVDLRKGSATFGKWHAIELADGDGCALLIPPGCAHGFQALSDDARLLYHHTAQWTPECEDGVRHDDPSLAIAWPLPPGQLSVRDRGLPFLFDSFEPVSV
jgi:dTDP-4-dehydrorhamnose 3,5-epimerase